jgi:hypothetical protein
LETTAQLSAYFTDRRYSRIIAASEESASLFPK